MSFGVNFLPGGDDQGAGPDQFGQQASGVPPIQQAIKFLALRLPRFLGPGAIAPGQLLAGPGAGGIPAGDVGPMPGIPGAQPGGPNLTVDVPGAPMPGSGNPIEEIIRRMAQQPQQAPPMMPGPPSAIPLPRIGIGSEPDMAPPPPVGSGPGMPPGVFPGGPMSPAGPGYDQAPPRNIKRPLWQ